MDFITDTSYNTASLGNKARYPYRCVFGLTFVCGKLKSIVLNPKSFELVTV